MQGTLVLPLGTSEETDSVQPGDSEQNTNGDTDQELNQKGIELGRSGKYEEAIETFNMALTINPENAEVWYNIGKTYSDLGDNEEALRSYNQALAINPDISEAWYNMGLILYEQGKYEDSLEAFDKAIEIDPDDQDARDNRMIVADKISAENTYNGQSALPDGDQLPGRTDTAEELTRKGIELSKQKLTENALEAFNAAIQIDPTYIEAWFRKGFTLDTMKRYDEAIEAYDQVLTLNPDHEDAQLYREIDLNLLKIRKES